MLINLELTPGWEILQRGEVRPEFEIIATGG